jgi:hypothetical protein
MLPKRGSTFRRLLAGDFWLHVAVSIPQRPRARCRCPRTRWRPSRSDRRRRGEASATRLDRPLGPLAPAGRAAPGHLSVRRYPPPRGRALASPLGAKPRSLAAGGHAAYLYGGKSARTRRRWGSLGVDDGRREVGNADDVNLGKLGRGQHGFRDDRSRRRRQRISAAAPEAYVAASAGRSRRRTRAVCSVRRVMAFARRGTQRAPPAAKRQGNNETACPNPHGRI